MKSDKENNQEVNIETSENAVLYSVMRSHSMQWWDNLSSATKTQICDTNTELLGVARRWETLTGCEIENLCSYYA